MPAHERDAALLEPRELGRVVEVVDHLVAPREHRAHVERARRDAGYPPRLGGELDGPQQRLRRHARIEGALAADEPLLDDRHLQTRLAEAPGDHLAGRPCADHDHVELAFLHRRLLVVAGKGQCDRAPGGDVANALAHAAVQPRSRPGRRRWPASASRGRK